MLTCVTEITHNESPHGALRRFTSIVISKDGSNCFSECLSLYCTVFWPVQLYISGAALTDLPGIRQAEPLHDLDELFQRFSEAGVVALLLPHAGDSLTCTNKQKTLQTVCAVTRARIQAWRDGDLDS